MPWAFFPFCITVHHLKSCENFLLKLHFSVEKNLISQRYLPPSDFTLRFLYFLQYHRLKNRRHIAHHWSLFARTNHEHWQPVMNSCGCTGLISCQQQGQYSFPGSHQLQKSTIDRLEFSTSMNFKWLIEKKSSSISQFTVHRVTKMWCMPYVPVVFPTDKQKSPKNMHITFHIYVPWRATVVWQGSLANAWSILSFCY